jgi:hypothetical protein
MALNLSIQRCSPQVPWKRKVVAYGKDVKTGRHLTVAEAGAGAVTLPIEPSSDLQVEGNRIDIAAAPAPQVAMFGQMVSAVEAARRAGGCERLAHVRQSPVMAAPPSAYARVPHEADG